MFSQASLTVHVGQYQAMAEQIRQAYTDIDQETLTDTLEGLSDLPDLLQAIIRSSLLDEALAAALKARLEDMKARLERLQSRQDRKRELVCQSLADAGMEKLNAEDFSVSLRKGPSRLSVIDEAKVPPFYWIAQAPRLDRAGLLAALKRGDAVEGAALEEGAAFIQVRTK